MFLFLLPLFSNLLGLSFSAQSEPYRFIVTIYIIMLVSNNWFSGDGGWAWQGGGVVVWGAGGKGVCGLYCCVKDFTVFACESFCVHLTL